MVRAPEELSGGLRGGKPGWAGQVPRLHQGVQGEEGRSQVDCKHVTIVYLSKSKRTYIALRFDVATKKQ